MTAVWVSLFILAFAGAVFATVLATLEYWEAFVFFLIVYVAGIAALSSLAVTT